MSNTELIKELRSLTQAGMKDCKDALEESNWDLQKAVDIVKAKGLNVVSGRQGKVASEGVVAVSRYSGGAALVEVNCQTDFVANSPDFRKFATTVSDSVVVAVCADEPFTVESVEQERQALVSVTKENVVVRRWWVEEAVDPTVRVFNYVHSNAKIGVLLSLKAPTVEAANSQEFTDLGNDLAMQVAAMNPSAVSADRLDVAAVERQKNIFETQLLELNKPQAAWPKILEGKFNKWYTEVTLLNQESVVTSKVSVAKVIESVGSKLGGEITVVNFIRAQVGEGIEKSKEQLDEEVSKLLTKTC